jgi:hypothetical protein
VLALMTVPAGPPTMPQPIGIETETVELVNALDEVFDTGA